MAVTDYLRGTGTQSDPYIIHNAVAWMAFLSKTEPCFMTTAYFEVVADINCGGLSTVDLNKAIFNATLNGNGYKISDFKFAGTYMWAHTSNGYSGKLLNIHIDAVFSTRGITSNYGGTWAGCNNVKFTIRGGVLYINSYVFTGNNNGSNLKDIIIELVSGGIFESVSSTLPADVYLLSEVAFSNAYLNATCLIGEQRYFPSNYPTLDVAKWKLDGVSTPTLIQNGRADLTQKYAVKGNTKIGGVGKSRTIAVYIAAYGGLIKKSASVANGDYLIDVGDVYDPVIVTHYDSYGFPFVPSKTYSLGDVIHPKVPNGYAYDCTTSGVSSGTEPTTWPTSGTLTTGAAIFTPRPIYKPESHLVQPVKIDLLTGLPV